MLAEAYLCHRSRCPIRSYSPSKHARRWTPRSPRIRRRSSNKKTLNDAIHLQVKTQGEIELAGIEAALDAKMTVLETYLKAAIEAGKAQRSYPPVAKWAGLEACGGPEAQS